MEESDWAGVDEKSVAWKSCGINVSMSPDKI
jgi:hypothetical protein